MNEINYEELGTIELLKEAEKGDLVALNQLGRRYEIGDRIEQDTKKALEAFDKVYKESKDEDTKYLAGATIGEIYMLDENLKDEKLAEKYLKESSEFGTLYGRWLYGRYLLGEDFKSERTDEQYKEAVGIFLELFKEAKEDNEKSLGEIAHTLSYIYLNGKGVEKDLYKAKEYAECAYNSSKDDAEQQFLNYVNEEIKKVETQVKRGEITKGSLVENENKMNLITTVDFNGGYTFESLMETLYDSTFINNIPCKASYIEMRIGNILTGTIEPACMFYHPEHIDDYFYYVFRYKTQGNMGRLFIYSSGKSTQASKANFNERMKHSGGGLISKTFSLAARGVNAIGKDKTKFEEEQMYYAAFIQNIKNTFRF